MTYAELSNAFDVYSNRHSEQKLGSLLFFDEYEKSLFLTKAANDIVKEMLPFYDRNEKIKKQLLTITRSAQISAMATISDDLRLKKNSIIYELPEDVLYVVAESLRDANGVILNRIKPLKDDEAYHTFENPFRSSTRGYALRNGLSISTSGVVKRYSEIITSIPQSSSPEYFIKYICKIPPFIVSDTLNNASVDGTSINNSLNNEAPLYILHEKILDRAITIAFMAKSDDPNSKTTATALSKDS